MKSLYIWLNFVNPSNANNFRNCNTSGALNNNNANSSNGVAPDHIIQDTWRVSE